MARYLVKRLVSMVPVLIGVTFLSFCIVHLAPGKPTDILSELNPKMTPEARQRLEQYYGLDKPLPVQYGRWLRRIVMLDFGNSFSPDARPVLEKIWDPHVPLPDRRLVVTLTINVCSLLVILCVALPIGIYSAVRPYSFFDRVSTVFVFVGFATPSFWLALLMMLLFSVNMGWLPISGLTSMDHDSLSVAGQLSDRVRHLVLPVFISSFGGLAAMSRYMRSSMLDAMRHDCITTARAKGLPETAVIFRHGVRNALLPIITLLGLSIPGLISGSVIFEWIFGIPGMGQLSFQAIMTRDYPVVMCLLLISSALTLLGNLTADVCYALADPRIRTGGHGH